MRPSRHLPLDTRAAGSFGPASRRGPGLVREILSPANLALGAVLLLGWLALVGWTGAGPTGWQARLCAGLDLQPRACSAVQITGEAAALSGSAAGRAS